MNEMPYDEIENITKEDIGKVCLMTLGSQPLAVEDTLEECIEVYENTTGETVDPDLVNVDVDIEYLAAGDLVAVEVCDTNKCWVCDEELPTRTIKDRDMCYQCYLDYLHDEGQELPDTAKKDTEEIDGTRQWKEIS